MENYKLEYTLKTFQNKIIKSDNVDFSALITEFKNFIVNDPRAEELKKIYEDKITAYKNLQKDIDFKNLTTSFYLNICTLYSQVCDYKIDPFSFFDYEKQPKTENLHFDSIREMINISKKYRFYTPQIILGYTQPLQYCFDIMNSTFLPGAHRYLGSKLNHYNTFTKLYCEISKKVNNTYSYYLLWREDFINDFFLFDNDFIMLFRMAIMQVIKDFMKFIKNKNKDFQNKRLKKRPSIARLQFSNESGMFYLDGQEFYLTDAEKETMFEILKPKHEQIHKSKHKHSRNATNINKKFYSCIEEKPIFSNRNKFYELDNNKVKYQ